MLPVLPVDTSAMEEQTVDSFDNEMDMQSYSDTMYMRDMDRVMHSVEQNTNSVEPDSSEDIAPNVGEQSGKIDSAVSYTDSSIYSIREIRESLAQSLQEEKQNLECDTENKDHGQ